MQKSWIHSISQRELKSNYNHNQTLISSKLFVKNQKEKNTFKKVIPFKLKVYESISKLFQSVNDYFLCQLRVSNEKKILFLHIFLR